MKQFFSIFTFLITINLSAQPTYQNIVIDIDGVAQAFSQNIIEIDSFYYFAGQKGGGPLADTGTIVKINKYTEEWNYSQNEFSSGNNNDFILPLPNSHRLLIAGIEYDSIISPGIINICLFEVDTDSLQLIQKVNFGLPSPSSEFLRDIIPTSDGGYAIVGSTAIFDPIVNFVQIYVLKLDSDLNMLWQRVLPSNVPNGDDYKGFGITENEAGELAMVGINSSNSTNKAHRIFLKLDANGNLISFVEEEPSDAEGRIGPADIINYSNGYICVGSRRRKIQQAIDARSHHYFGLDQNGQIIWSKEYDFLDSATGLELIPSGDGNFLVAGGEREHPFVVDNSYVSYRQWGTITKITPTGERIWHRRYSEEVLYQHKDVFRNLTITEDNGILLIGDTYKEETFQDYWVLKLDSMGCQFPGCDSLAPEAMFSYEVNDLTVNFKDESKGKPDSWLWFFSDPMVGDFFPEVTHSFQDTGVYEVCLQVENSYGKSRHCEEVSLLTTATTEILNSELVIYPNPTEGQFAVSLTSGLLIEGITIFNMSSERILEVNIQGTSKYEIDISNEPAGQYILRIVVDGGEVIDRVIKI